MISMPTTEPDSAFTTQTTCDLFHVGLNASDLDRAIRFYTVLFGQPPLKHYSDYARFELAEPPLVVALYPSQSLPGGPLNHLGLRLRDSAELVEVQRRLEEAGMPTQRQDDVECCYSRQTKFWVTDPDRNLWEIYTLHDDLDHSGFDDPPVAQHLPQREAIWEHRITQPIPDPLPFDDQSLDEVRLEGTFNTALPDGALDRLLSETFRVLKPGGRIAVRGLPRSLNCAGRSILPGQRCSMTCVSMDYWMKRWLSAWANLVALPASIHARAAITIRMPGVLLSPEVACMVGRSSARPVSTGCQSRTGRHRFLICSLPSCWHWVSIQRSRTCLT